MDFIPQREFFHPEVQSKMKRKRTSENVFLSLIKFSGLPIILRLLPESSRPTPLLRSDLRPHLLLEKEKHGAEVFS